MEDLGKESPVSVSVSVQLCLSAAPGLGTEARTDGLPESITCALLQ